MPRNPHEVPVRRQPVQRGPADRLPPGLVTPRRVYRRLILRLLLRAPNHTLRSIDVRRAIERRLANRFTEADHEPIRRNQPRWVNNMQWARKRLVMDHFMETKESAGYGVWKLTDNDGVREAAAGND